MQAQLSTREDTPNTFGWRGYKSQQSTQTPPVHQPEGLFRPDEEWKHCKMFLTLEESSVANL